MRTFAFGGLQTRSQTARALRPHLRSGRNWVASVLCVGMIALALPGCTPSAPTIWKTDTLDKCQKGIESEASKLSKKIFGVLKKCKDDYRKAILKGDPLTKAADKCEGKLQKTVLFPDPAGKSAIAKTKAKLDKLTDPAKTKCTDTDLVALGHLPTANFDDLWARLILMQALKSAIEQQILLVQDTVDIFQQLAAAGCPSCTQIAQPPCARSACVLGGGPSSVSVDVCEHTGILGTEFGIFAAPARTFLPSPVGGGVTLCLKVIRGEGYIAGTGSTLQKIKAETCQDHIADDGDECPGLLGAGTLCASSQADSFHGGTTNAGVCLRLSDNGAGGGGTSFLFATAQLWTVCDGVGGCGADTRGADGLACTVDDTAEIGATVTAPFTTDVTEGKILDLDNTDGATALPAPSTGNAFTSDDVAAGILSGGKWVGGRPVLHLNGGTDGFFGTELECD